MANMDALRMHYFGRTSAEYVRGELLDCLLQKIDDMQKTMDRNAFVMVLIDGDCMNFLDELVQQGIAGGDTAAKRLRKAIFDYLRSDDGFKYDYEIVIRVYANMRGLSKTYSDKGILPTTTKFDDFALGFNKAYPLCDFIDAGNHKEAADTKIKEVLKMHVYNTHCKQIVFGGSADNGYASFLSSFFVNTDESSRIRLLKGPPFSSEFQKILKDLKWTEFTDVFRSSLISDSLTQHSTPNRSPRNEQLFHQGDELSAINDSLPTPRHKGTSTNSALPQLATFNSDSDDEDDFVSVGSHYTQSPAPSNSSSYIFASVKSTKIPSAAHIEQALVRCTNERLSESPKALDFGVVKQKVEQALNLTSDFWVGNEWFLRSKNIIKMTVEDWVERTNNPPPKNATWMLRYFGGTESPSTIMKKPSSMAWRTSVDLSFSNRINPISNRKFLTAIYLNAEEKRVDVVRGPNIDLDVVAKLRAREPHLCISYHLVGLCTDVLCPYYHNEITDIEFNALAYLSQSRPCPQGSHCRQVGCVKGHVCPSGTPCRYTPKCRFADLHDMNTDIVYEVVGDRKCLTGVTD